MVALSGSLTSFYQTQDVTEGSALRDRRSSERWNGTMSDRRPISMRRQCAEL
jgi:hypothetical protein